MIEWLQIALKTKAAEAKAVRAVEKKQRRIVSFETQAGVKRGSGHFRHQKDQPRPEPRKYPEPREDTQQVCDEAYAKFWGLQRYRTVQLRREARVNHLAYGFLRGHPYKDIEQKTHNAIGFFLDPNAKNDAPAGGVSNRMLSSVRQVAKKYSSNSITPQEFEQKWEQWVQEAKKHLLSQIPPEVVV